MNECKDCIYWKSSDVKKPLAWGHCNYFDINELPQAPIWATKNLCFSLVHGYVSPTQKRCNTFKKNA